MSGRFVLAEQRVAIVVDDGAGLVPGRAALGEGVCAGLREVRDADVRGAGRVALCARLPRGPPRSSRLPGAGRELRGRRARTARGARARGRRSPLVRGVGVNHVACRSRRRNLPRVLGRTLARDWMQAFERALAPCQRSARASTSTTRSSTEDADAGPRPGAASEPGPGIVIAAFTIGGAPERLATIPGMRRASPVVATARASCSSPGRSTARCCSPASTSAAWSTRRAAAREQPLARPGGARRLAPRAHGARGRDPRVRHGAPVRPRPAASTAGRARATRGRS